MAPPRLLSHTEIETAQTCFARHAFRYTGHLTGGDTLRSRAIPRRLSEGRAWGAAAAKWHERGKTLLASLEAAEALRTSLDADETWMAERGHLLAPEERTATEAHLLDVFAHYTTSAPMLEGLTRLEDEVTVPIPSRTGRHASTRYRFQAYLDGWTLIDGHPWLVEFKLRGRLSSLEILQMNRQLRWYAWALRQSVGVEPVGVLVDETWNTAPAEPRIVQARSKGLGIDGMVPSHASNQQTTRERYEYACRYYGVTPNVETAEHLDQIRWHQRVPIIFRQGEIDEAGEELVTAAKLIRDLDNGELYPIRHAVASACGGCSFQSICPNPSDELYVETLFERTVPKRLREPEQRLEAA